MDEEGDRIKANRIALAGRQSTDRPGSRTASRRGRASRAARHGGYANGEWTGPNIMDPNRGGGTQTINLDTKTREQADIWYKLISSILQ